MSEYNPQYKNIIDEIKKYISTNTLNNDQIVEYMRSKCKKLDNIRVDMSLSCIKDINLGDERADIILKSYLAMRNSYNKHALGLKNFDNYCVYSILAYIGNRSDYLIDGIFAYIDPKSSDFLEGFRLYMKYVYDAEPCLYEYINDTLAINKEQLIAGLNYLLQVGDGDAIFSIFLDYTYYDLKDAQDVKVIRRYITPEDYYQCIKSFIYTIRKHPNTKKLYHCMKNEYKELICDSGKRCLSNYKEYKDDDELVSEIKKLKL